MIRGLDTCPICGHHNWCGQDSDTGLYYCHYQDSSAVHTYVNGVDGTRYYLIKENSSGDGHILISEDQKKREDEEWRKSHPKSSSSHLPRCPICGGENTCSSWENKRSLVPGAVTYCCHGIKKQVKKITGMDKRAYHVIKEGKEGGYLAETYDQYVANAKAYYEKPEAVQPLKTPTPQVTSTLRSNAELDEVYRYFIGMLGLIPEHYDQLKAAGWTDDMISEYHIVSMPPSDKDRWNKMVPYQGYYRTPWRHELCKRMVEKFDNLEGVPGFYLAPDRKTGEKVWRFCGKSGILFFSQDVKGHLFGAQIRKDDTTGGKYSAWSSNPDAKNSKGEYIYPHGTGLLVQAGFVYHPEVDTSYVAYVTEGYKKACIGNKYKHAPFVSLPGVGQLKTLLENPDESLIITNYLASIGTKLIIFAYDADKATNANVLRFEGKGIQMMKDAGFRVAVADWTQHRAYAKGIDDLLVLGLDVDYQEM